MPVGLYWMFLRMSLCLIILITVYFNHPYIRADQKPLLPSLSDMERKFISAFTRMNVPKYSSSEEPHLPGTKGGYDPC